MKTYNYELVTHIGGFKKNFKEIVISEKGSFDVASSYVKKNFPNSLGILSPTILAPNVMKFEIIGATGTVYLKRTN